MSHSFKHLSPKDRLAVKLAEQKKKRPKKPVTDQYGNRSATGPDKGQSFKQGAFGSGAGRKASSRQFHRGR
jgi:hypothetical protein